MFSTSPDCTLEFPAILGEDPDHQTDSAVFLDNPLYNGIQPVGSKQDSGLPLHLAADYEEEDKSLGPCCFKQVVKSMVASLRQRRSLGFPNHIVFGMTQLGHRIEILAGHSVSKQTALDGPGMTQQRAENAPDAPAVKSQGLITAAVNEDGERPAKHRKACGDAGAGNVPQEDEYQVRGKIFRSLLSIHDRRLDQDLLSWRIFCKNT
jgi:hypothetical protein